LKTESVIAANRFGLGARPGELERIDNDPQALLLDQLQGPPRLPAELRDLPSSASALLDVQQVRQMRREERLAVDDEPAPDIVRQYGATIRQHYIEQTDARFRVATGTDYPFHERLVHFWSNHFAVSADKQPIPAIAGLYENEAIRPNIGGTFADLLLAVESHPAMIVYLDNQRSIGPGSTLAQRAARRRSGRAVGLNENLAREILELHTLGVDGGYTQQDVTAFAHVITGWSVGGGDDRRLAEGTPGEFEFREVIHEPGSQTVLGRTYRQRGMDQGIAVLKDLASHPATAKFIATKLATHFISDTPPAESVQQIEKVFLDTGGDLPSVHKALVEAEAAWTATFKKYKSPRDFVISAFRAFDRVPENGRLVVGALDQMGQTPFRPGSPAGWPDTAEAWGGADALYKRVEWANAVGRLAGSRANPLAIAESVMGPTLGDHTRTAIARAESVSQGLTLFLVSPEFQRR
jgi:uncharacterized protein (DUF1800 family)